MRDYAAIRLLSRQSALKILRAITASGGLACSKEIAEGSGSPKTATQILLLELYRRGIVGRVPAERDETGGSSSGRPPYVYYVVPSVREWMESSERVLDALANVRGEAA